MQKQEQVLLLLPLLLFVLANKRRLRGRSGLVDAGFGAGVVVGAGFGAVEPAGGVVPGVPLVPVALAGVEGGAAGNTVSGVGSGGKGFAKIPATNSGMPSVTWLFLNLYQVVRLSCQIGFCAVNLESLPATATARAYPSIMRSTSW